ncbi:hypothetical protein NEMBOFW57_010728 [Staphylotrichum longicolle]|uniref:Uncharacterized protein n=1 Tax=Staphylotrichum longicolle TaxID=669026 RepID=A0AAD4HVJ1_9PEZI|nr:hypothetical protein NEMBOFW57_010728 [Staphylotrichum longicolle]
MAPTSEGTVCGADLAAAAEDFAAELRHEGDRSGIPQPLDPADAPEHIYTVQQALFTTVDPVPVMSRQSSEFLRGLALHTQLLACLQWLCEFQVLACVPLDDSVAFSDVADICGVPEGHLCRVTRLMATAGFLREPRPGHIAHSPVSAQFVTEPALLDAAMFLAGTAAPAALKMPLATRQFAGSERADQSAYAAAFDTGIPLANVFELQPRLQRQFATFLSFTTSDDQANVRDILMRVDWANLGHATVVDIGAPSASFTIGLAALFPSLQFIVQTYEPSPSGSSSLALGGGCITLPSPVTAGCPGSSSAARAAEIPAHLSGRITLQKRIAGTTQFARTAAVYVLHLPPPSPSLPWSAVASHAVSELTAHLDVLRTNPGARLILTALVLPPQGAVDAEMEAAARVRDLSLLQLANGRHAEKAEVVDLLNGIRDSAGGFVLTDEIRSPTSAFVAWEIRYQAYDDLKR